MGAIVMLVIIPRIGIAFVLGVSGVIFLVVTTSVEDLILNALALEVILIIDELLFRVLFSRAVRDVLTTTRPLLSPPVCSSKVGGMLTLLKHALFLSWIYGVFHVGIRPQLLNIMKAEEWMCSGNTTFVTALGPNGLLYILDAEAGAEVRDSYRFRATLQATGLDQLHGMPVDPHRLFEPLTSGELHEFGLGEPSVETLQKLERMTQAEYAQFASCRDDKGDGNFSALIESLKIISSDTLARTCHDLAPYGSQQAGHLVRLNCPVSSGCASPTSGLLWTRLDLGCPSACRPYFEEKLESVDCVDAGPGAMGWRNYFSDDGIRGLDWQRIFVRPSVNLSVAGGLRAQALFLEKMRNGTCTDLIVPPTSEGGDGVGMGDQALLRLWRRMATDLCNPISYVLQGRRSLRPLCPRACNCSATMAIGDRAECPRRCRWRRMGPSRRAQQVFAEL